MNKYKLYKCLNVFIRHEAYSIKDNSGEVTLESKTRDNQSVRYSRKALVCV